MRTSFDYLTAGTNETGRVESMNTSLYNGSELQKDLGTLSYTYDEIGNIKTVSENGVLKVTYTYDGLNRLIREDNAVDYTSYTYSYDAGGNITETNEYSYTTGDLGESWFTRPYTYGDSDWSDLLTGAEVFSFTNDEMGNLISGGGGITASGVSMSVSMDLSWTKGRQLSSYEHRTVISAPEYGIEQDDSVLSEYEYGYNGLRTKKAVSYTSNGVTQSEAEILYTYAGELLISQSDGTNTLEWAYGAGGEMIGFKLNGTDNYYYLRNLQGDVIGIYDDNGDVVCRYYYDAWGDNIKITDGNGNWLDSEEDTDHIAIINPIRYRGYYYDNESELYYLQSRYYAPVFKRFINADALFIAGDALTGANMFAYCNNNPVMFSDPSGYAPFDGFGKFFRQLGMMVQLFFAGVNIVTISNASNSYNSLATLYNEKIGGKAYPVKGITGKGSTYSGHGNARDFAASEGTPIYAAMGGTVTTVVMKYSSDFRVGNTGKMNECGNYIEITLPNGTMMRYAHQIISNYVEKGDVVIAGQIIGLVGSTGHSTGNHLHLYANRGDILDYFLWQ